MNKKIKNQNGEICFIIDFSACGKYNGYIKKKKEKIDMAKKTIGIVLSLLLIFALIPTAFASENTGAQLYTFYGNGMLFKQNEEAVIAGTGNTGSVIKAELYLGSTLVSSGSTAVEQDGTFAVSFASPSGGYDEYKVVLTADSKEFAVLENVVFGELWIASGQSNMQYPLSQDKDGVKLYESKAVLDEYIRVLLVPAVPEYNGSTSCVPYEPQNDIVGATWTTGEDESIYDMSAVAYYFADEMRKELDIPVGILNIPLGGSAIDSWISKKAIDSDPKVKNDLLTSGEYISESDWVDSNINIYYDMGANYNMKVEALRHFNVSGLIWYQGESDIIFEHSPERYERAIELMQRSYTEVFGYEDGLLPIISTQLAGFYYSSEDLSVVEMNAAFTSFSEKDPSSRATVTITDVPLTFVDELGSIHPEQKKDVGQRMAQCAFGLVYNKGKIKTAATVSDIKFEDGAAYVTFKNTGDGIASDGDRIYGFALCDTDGIYVQADAQIVGTNTVKVQCDEIASPCGVSFAYCANSLRANVFSTDGDKLVMPVAGFASYTPYGTHYWIDEPWMDCDTLSTWRSENNSYSGFYNIWEVDDAEITVTEQSAFDGAGGLQITSDSKRFSVKPTVTYTKEKRTVDFYDFDKNYTQYGKISFHVRNNGKNDVTLESFRLYTSSVTWYSPEVEGANESCVTIPADGQWHEIVLDLTKLYLMGNECGFTYGNCELDDLYDIKLYFSADGETNLSMDEFRFTPAEETTDTRFDVDVKNADNIFEFISALFVKIVSFFAKLFS